MNKLRTHKTEAPKKKRGNVIASSFAWVISGTMLTKKNVVKQLPFLIMLMVFSLIYIGNIYSTEELIRTVNKLERENKELYYKHIVMKSKLTREFNRQSEVAKKLTGTGVKETVVPPQKIYSVN
ncbi:MAG TPA: FtsL-like putative cell division protein [Bacteroidales bacterium]|nr:FtsL-like putative cell division protein [Bacteroidales bacterium]